MARPRKSLQQHIRDGSFRPRRETHRQLLGGADVRWGLFANLQARYRAASSEAERRAVAVEFGRLVQRAHGELERRIGGVSTGSLDEQLAQLGRPRSAKRLLRFFPRYYRHPKGPKIGQPFTLEGWQQQFLREFYRRDKHGERVYRLGILGIPRGNGKTPLAAGVGLYELVARADAPEVYFAAGSKEQAAIGLEFARSFVEAGELEEHVHVRSGLTCPERRGVMRVISSDGRLQHGRAPAVGIVDELWALESRREEETYIALSSALHKREDAFLLALTTAGYDKHSLLGRIYQQALAWPWIEQRRHGCLTIAKDIDNGSLLWWYGAPEGADLDNQQIWRACNPASWIKLTDLRRQLHDPGLGEAEYRRLHLNQWTSARDAWLPHGCWAGLRSEIEIPDGAPIYLGVDVGLCHDSTAVVWAHTLEDGRIALRAHVWAAQADASAHSHWPDGKVELEQVEQFICELGRRYRIREVAYDPRFFERSAQILEKAGLTMVEFLQASAPMADAYQRFYQAAKEGTLTHDGDPILAEHIEATAADKTERGWRIKKLKSSSQVDATVAAVLAVARAQHHKNDAPPQIFWLDA